MKGSPLSPCHNLLIHLYSPSQSFLAHPSSAAAIAKRKTMLTGMGSMRLCGRGLAPNVETLLNALANARGQRLVGATSHSPCTVNSLYTIHFTVSTQVYIFSILRNAAFLRGHHKACVLLYQQCYYCHLTPSDNVRTQRSSQLLTSLNTWIHLLLPLCSLYIPGKVHRFPVLRVQSQICRVLISRKEVKVTNILATRVNISHAKVLLPIGWML